MATESQVQTEEAIGKGRALTLLPEPVPHIALACMGRSGIPARRVRQECLTYGEAQSPRGHVCKMIVHIHLSFLYDPSP